jgi:hypothetical protein
MTKRRPSLYTIELPTSLNKECKSKRIAMNMAQQLATSWRCDCGIYKRIAIAKPKLKKAK